MIFAELDAGDIVPIVMFGCLFGVIPLGYFIFSTVSTVAVRWMDNRLKRKLLDRGLSVDEIERVINAGELPGGIFGRKKKTKGPHREPVPPVK
ncbi:MAG: hypothetical protein AAF456_18910 [Planctomycetota bacterium]